MSELYLSYAGFVYYVNKHGYNLIPGKNYLSLWQPSRTTHFFSVYVDKTPVDCGVVYTTHSDLEYVFHESPELLEILLKTIRLKPKLGQSESACSHCSIEPSLRGKIATNIGGEIIQCLRYNNGG
jgi:hypothetical protein